MSSLQRPKRHAPKKVDPDFVVDSVCFHPTVRSPHKYEGHSPPKKKNRISVDKPLATKGPGSKPTGTQSPGSKPTANQWPGDNQKPDQKTENGDQNPIVECSSNMGSFTDPNDSMNTNMVSMGTNSVSVSADIGVSENLKPKGRGRPKGSKNKPKQVSRQLPSKLKPKALSTSLHAKAKGPSKVISKTHKVKKESQGKASGDHGNHCGHRGHRSTELKLCDRSTCQKVRPICAVRASDKCDGSGHTSRWYHLSQGEHFCNDCFEFFYRSHKRGCRIFNRWKQRWNLNGYTEATIKVFMADQLLPYWLQCYKCQKWRQVSRDLCISPQYISKYQCGMSLHGEKKEGDSYCLVEEDERVSQTKEESWSRSLAYNCYLQRSPAAPYMNLYYQDMVGLSAYYNTRHKAPGKATSSGQLTQNVTLSDVSDIFSDSEESDEDLITSCELPPPIQYAPTKLPCWSDPFLKLDEETEGAMMFFPHLMNLLEMEEFPEYRKEQCLYLGLRNLAVILWNSNCKTCVTVDQCMSNVICRGLTRIRCLKEVPRVLRFLSRHGYINSGAVTGIPPELKPSLAKEHHVLVIGAGAAGLAAARHLHNYGIKVTVLEAKSTVGGRCHDNLSMGFCVGEGAQIINCLTNNPLTVLCHQLSIPFWRIEDRCELFQESGSVTEGCLDRRMDFHFNAMLDNVAEWRKQKKQTDDTNLMVKIKEMHTQFVDETQLTFSEEEEKLLEFHISNLEYACGCCLDQVSSLYWDQNELYPQFGGSHCIVTEGFQKLLKGVCQGLDVRCNTQVTRVDHTSTKVLLETADGTRYSGDKVIVTVPLAVLKNKTIDFSPELPQSKVDAINSLGAGVVEKVALKFPTRFWMKKTKGSDFFGHVPESGNGRGQFGMFYDMKPQVSMNQEVQVDSAGVLVTYLSGNAVHQMSHKSDKDIVNHCMEVLRKLFPEQAVPDPVAYFVSQWGRDPDIGMAYTYVPVGCHPSTFVDLAETVNNKVHFAGEATNRQLPQSVTGAYLSGVREATHILHELDQVDLQTSTPHCPVIQDTLRGRQQKIRFEYQEITKDTVKPEKSICRRKKAVLKVRETPGEEQEHHSQNGPAANQHHSENGPAATQNHSENGPAATHDPENGPAATQHHSEDGPAATQKHSENGSAATQHHSENGPAAIQHHSEDGPAATDECQENEEMSTDRLSQCSYTDDKPPQDNCTDNKLFQDRSTDERSPQYSCTDDKPLQLH